MGLSESFYERVMANVNLKVMMRIGDNRTAADMTEWFGKIKSTKRSVGAGVMTGVSSSSMRGPLDINARRSGGESQSVSYSEDEKDLVSAEELKHEMSAEKGLAWFDLGNGRIVKGRSFWFNAELPETWEGREFLVRPERFELDEVGLADWVDEQILAQEEGETSERFAPKRKESPEVNQVGNTNTKAKDKLSADVKGGSTSEKDKPGAFKLNADKPPSRSRGIVTTLAKSPSSKDKDANDKDKNKPGSPKNGPFKLRK
jgi:hypothetical protein